MTKRLVDIDDDLLDSARARAGTKTIKATVEAGLRRLMEDDLGVRHVRRLRKPGALSRRAVEEARQPRAGPDA